MTSLGAVVLAVGSALTNTTAVAETAYALIMGGTGRPDPQDFPGYMPNVTDYYIEPNTSCFPEECDIEQVSVFTPETAWPLYGGAQALTWDLSILTGVELYDDAVREQLANLADGDKVVLFGYSQSGEILAFEKIRLSAIENKDDVEIVVIGNSSRPNGGINSRTYAFSIPIVNFPFGPAMPTDTGIKTTDIAFKWSIIEDAPLYITNPLAMANALLGFFGGLHGSMPDPTEASPDRTPGGYSVEQWQAMMDDPEAFPDIIDIQTFGDTTYITVTPTVLPLVQPLHDIGLTALADLLEPALRVIIEETGYDRSIPFGQPTNFALIPIFDPITLVVDLIPAIGEGVAAFFADLGLGGATVPVSNDPGVSEVSTPDSGPAPVESGDSAPLALQTAGATSKEREAAAFSAAVADDTGNDAGAAPEPEADAVDDEFVGDETTTNDSSGPDAISEDVASDDVTSDEEETGDGVELDDAVSSDDDDTATDSAESDVAGADAGSSTSPATSSSSSETASSPGDSTTGTAGSGSDKAVA